MRGWDDKERSYTKVIALFNRTFRRVQIGISKSTVSRSIKRFQETRSYKNRPISGGPKSATSGVRQMEVAQAFVENHSLSIIKARQQLEMPTYSLLTPQIVPALQQVAGDDFNDVWYQQDGASAHYRVWSHRITLTHQAGNSQTKPSN
ncbi:hypothetical protein PV327_011271, partial [Microctonus hyperodae]